MTSESKTVEAAIELVGELGYEGAEQSRFQPQAEQGNEPQMKLGEVSRSITSESVVSTTAVTTRNLSKKFALAHRGSKGEKDN